MTQIRRYQAQRRSHHSLTFGCVRPAVVTITIGTHDNEVLDSLAMLVVDLVIVEVERDEGECGRNGPKAATA